MRNIEMYTKVFLSPANTTDSRIVLWQKTVDTGALIVSCMSLVSKSLVGAFIIFLLVFLFVEGTRKQSVVETPSVDIGIEHTQTGILALTVTRNDVLRMIKIENKNTEAIEVSVPQDWKRGEVRNATLLQVTSEPPSFSYVRWHIPAHATVTFTTDHPFAHLSLHNPGGKLLQINFTQVDLVTNAGLHDVYLVKDGAVEVP